MTTRRNLVAVTVAALIGGLAFPGSASVASPARARTPLPRLVVLAGSADYLAYAEYAHVRSGSRWAKGTLQVLTPGSPARSLGAIENQKPPGSALGERYSIVGPMLTAFSASDPTEVQWWDLADGGSGTAELPDGATWAGSTPDGWAFVAADELTIEAESTDGTVTSFGQPVADEVTADAGSITATTGPDGVVAVGDTTGEATYQTWSDPTSVVGLNDATAPGTAALDCGSVSTSIAACTDTGLRGDTTTKVVLPLDGSAGRAYDACAGDVVADGQRLVYICGTTTAHPHFAGGAAVNGSRAVVGPGVGVSAFGTFVTVGPKRQTIFELRNASARIHLLINLVPVPQPTLAQLDAANLRAAALDVEAQALNSGALTAAPSYDRPAQVLLVSADALIAAARARDTSLRPRRTTGLMGPVPAHLAHRTRGAPRHFHITRTRSLQPFSHAVPDSGSGGFGLSRLHGGSHPAKPLRADGVYVEPTLPAVANETIGMVAMRTALGRLGRPYVWAAAGPSTFDCSGLMQWSFAHAGVWLTHFSGDQYNEGRLIPARDILPGDLILFDHRVGGHQVIHHVGMYLGAGWMVNAPYTGQYVSVTQVPSGVAGVVRP